MDFIEGEVLYFDKPQNWTSFDLVNKTRNMLRQFLGIKKIKVGHAGTLDPLATGVMILCTGNATKRIDEYLNHDKEYITTIKLGATTPSFDKETEEDKQYETAHITKSLVEQTLKQFIGKISQIPPMYSAIRVNGKHAYEFARKNQEMKLEPRQVRIDSINLLEYDFPYIKIDVVCSKGTYIRSLARDIGEALGSGAYITSLQRTKIGQIKLSDCITIEEFQQIINKQE